MLTAQTPSTRKAWSKTFAQPAEEFDLTPLPVLAGKIPPGLRGTLYRNGPGRLERGGVSVGHWFDGDGAILAVHFTEAGATGIYRYIQTQGYQAEAKADKFLYGNYGMTYPGSLWKYWLGMLTKQQMLKNTGNTSVLALPDRLLALWEGGLPHALDLQTLETQGLDNLACLKPEQPYSAHPLRDPLTGEIFNVGVDITGTLHLYKSDRQGKIIQQSAINVGDVPFIHSFVLAGQYLIFFLPPMTIEKLPLLLGRRSYCDSLRWQDGQGTKIVVVERNTLEVVSRGETDPWFQWHFGNGCVEADGSVRLDLVKFSDFSQTNEYLREIVTGATQTLAAGHLWQIRLNPQTSQILEMQEVVNLGCEFPVVPPQQVGQLWRHTYFAMQRREADIAQEWFGAIARFDYQTATLTEADCGENCYTVEPLYLADALNPEQGWVVTVLYNGNQDCSQVWIFACDRLNDGPVCRLALPKVIPFSYHGTWKPEI